jgi:hypothetical protein
MTPGERLWDITIEAAESVDDLCRRAADRATTKDLLSALAGIGRRPGPADEDLFAVVERLAVAARAAESGLPGVLPLMARSMGAASLEFGSGRVFVRPSRSDLMPLDDFMRREMSASGLDAFSVVAGILSRAASWKHSACYVPHSRTPTTAPEGEDRSALAVR